MKHSVKTITAQKIFFIRNFFSKYDRIHSLLFSANSLGNCSCRYYHGHHGFLFKKHKKEYISLMTGVSVIDFSNPQLPFTCSKSSIETPEQCVKSFQSCLRSGIFIVNCENISSIGLVFSLLPLNKTMSAWQELEKMQLNILSVKASAKEESFKERLKKFSPESD